MLCITITESFLISLVQRFQNFLLLRTPFLGLSFLSTLISYKYDRLHSAKQRKHAFFIVNRLTNLQSTTI